jgi:hypothetical protein
VGVRLHLEHEFAHGSRKADVGHERADLRLGIGHLRQAHVMNLRRSHVGRGELAHEEGIKSIAVGNLPYPTVDRRHLRLGFQNADQLPISGVEFMNQRGAGSIDQSRLAVGGQVQWRDPPLEIGEYRAVGA